MRLREILGSQLIGCVLLIAGASMIACSRSGGSNNATLSITPRNAVVDVTSGQPIPTVLFKATLRGKRVAAVWSVDLLELGQFDGSGTFTPAGNVGGVGHVTATYQGQTATTTITIQVLAVQNGAKDGSNAPAGAGGYGGVGGVAPGGALPPMLQQAVQSTPVPDPGLTWLYPYDQTVWPLGLLAPLLQWKPGAAGDYDGIYVHIVETNYEYQGYFARSAKPFVDQLIPQGIWNGVTYSNSGEPVKVTLTFIAGGKAYGPLNESWTIAPEALPGTIFYQSYGTNLVHNYTATAQYNGQTIQFGGATLAIEPGKTSPVLVAGSSTECRVCHSVSADGSTLITQRGDSYSESAVYSVGTNDLEMPIGTSDGRLSFPGLFPDGSMLFSGSVPSSGPRWGWASSAPGGLFEVPSGMPIPGVQGLPAGLGGATPAFSPDGRHLAFNFVEGVIGTTNADQKSLASIDFDRPSLTFSNPQVLYTPAQGTAAWPSFLPTNDGVVFELEVASNGRDYLATRASCDSEGDPSGCADRGAQAELWWVDLKTRQAHRLDRLNGVGLPTAPDGHQNDAELNFEPTVSPRPAGGYAWVVFTSRRLYGNVATINPYWSDPRYHDLTSTPTPKKLWVAAIDLNAPPGTDPSHPAFYLPGQELLAGNSRGFWGRVQLQSGVTHPGQ